MRTFARKQRTASLLVLLCLAPLAGCGGGGSGSSTQSGKVSGRVFVPSGRATRAPVTVAVDGTTLSTVAGADGRFTLAGVPVGLHTVYAKSDKGAIAVVASVAGGEETNLGDLELADSGQISGLVTATVKGHSTPVAEAQVTVSPLMPDMATSTPFPIRSARTSPQGSYTVEGLPVGYYLVSVSAQGYQSATMVTDVGANRTSPADISLTAAAPAASGSMSGTVYLKLDDGSTQPIAGVLVRLAKSDDPRLMSPMPGDLARSAGAKGSAERSRLLPFPGQEYYAYTDEQGRYALEGVAAGEYVAAAVRPGLVPERKPVTITAEKALTQDFTLALRKAESGVVSGVVTDASTNKPIAGAQVSVFFEPPPPYALTTDGASAAAPSSPDGNRPIYIEPGDYTLYATTDAQGAYKLIAPPGPHKILVYADAYVSKQVLVTVTAGGQATANVALDKDAGAITVTGRTVTKDSSGAVVAVPKAEVYASYYYGPLDGVAAVVFTTTSDENGAFSLSLRGGAYFFGAKSDTLFARGQKVEVTANMAPVDIMMESGDSRAVKKP